MPEPQEAPYACQIFVCTNDRHGKKKSCADGDSSAIRSLLKAQIKDRGWKGRVRVSQSGCMGLCMKGPNVILYPENLWFSGVTEADIPEILAKVEPLV